MRQLSFWTLLLVTALFLLPIHSSAEELPGQRKLLDHAAPAYPSLARNMGLQGVVKVDVLVAPDGSMKSADIRGGHPVLAQAALNAVRRWRWEPAPHESHELIQMRFSPAD